MKVLETYLGLAILFEATIAQFLEQPDQGILFAPVDYEVTLTCSVEEGFVIDWRVVLPNGDEADASSGIARRVLMERGFVLEGVVTTRSTLLLRETEAELNNGTNITCVAQETGTQREPIMGDVVQVIFYAGAPPPPTNPSVTENEQGALNISWSLMVIEGVPVNYTLTVLSLNTTSTQPIIIAGLLDQHYVFETSRPCDVYSFTVTAVTAAGNSIPSQEIIFTRKGNSAICTTTTAEISSTTHSTASTTFSLPTTQTDFTQPLATSNSPTQGNSTIVLIAAVSIAFAVLMTVLVLVNAMICVFCYKKNKTELKPDLKDPVYEAPGDIPMLPISIKDRGTPFAMTSSSAYEVTGNSQEVPFKASSPSKSFKNDTESISYVPFAMKSSSAYEIFKNPDNQPLEVCKNSSPSKSSKNPEAKDSYVPFAMTSSAAYELSKNPQNLDTSDKSILSTDDASFAMTSSLAYEVSKDFDSDNKSFFNASPSAEKLNTESNTVKFVSSACEGPKNCKNLDSDDVITSPTTDESSKKLNFEGGPIPFAMTLSSAYEVSKYHKNVDSDNKSASFSADEFSSKLDTEGSTVPASSADGVSLTPQKRPTKSPDKSTSSSFSAYEPAKSLDINDDMADYVL